MLDSEEAKLAVFGSEVMVQISFFSLDRGVAIVAVLVVWQTLVLRAIKSQRANHFQRKQETLESTY
jgi:hypothetical protein